MPDRLQHVGRKPNLSNTDTGATLTVITVADGSIVFELAGCAHRAALIQPKYICPDDIPLAAGDVLTVARRGFNNDFVATGPCGCLYLLYRVVLLSPVRVVSGG